MINLTLLWSFLVPIILSAICLWLVPKITNGEYNIKDAAIFAGAGLLVSCLILTGAFYLGKGSKTADTEIWNGEVISKVRTHGSYVRSYSCNCRTITSGSGKNQSSSTVCDTCYEDHYTVSWDCKSNIGAINIDSKDWTSRGVYLVPDPARYTVIKPGDPVAKTNSYTNYIKAVPETLFRPAQESLKAQYAASIPEYPINVYDYYKVDRILPVGVVIPNIREWNDKLSMALKKLGPTKQANAVIVIVKANDPNYFYALQDAWLNGKKNDIILVIGASEFPKKAEWVNVMALTQSNIFQVKLRDDILALDELTADKVIDTLSKVTLESFKRKRMRDFEYLDGEIDPPEWVMLSSLAFILFVYLGGWYYLSRTSVLKIKKSVYNNSYRYRR